MSTALEAFITVFLIAAPAVLGVVIARQLLKNRTLDRHHQISGYFLSVIGTLYALVLGLIVVNAQSKFEQALAKAQSEANACSDMWNFSRGFAQPGRHNFRIHIKRYYETVQNQRWDLVANGLKNEESKDPFNELWQSLLEIEPVGEGESSCFQSCLTSMQELSDSRLYRVTVNSHAIPPVVWVVLLIGGSLTIAFTYLFRVENQRTQIALVTLVASFIGLNMALLVTFDKPYRNPLHVKASTFSLRPELLDDKPNTSQSK